MQPSDGFPLSWNKMQCLALAFRTLPGLVPDHLSNFIPRRTPSLVTHTSTETFFLDLENPKLAPISGLLHLLHLLYPVFFPYSKLAPSTHSRFSSSITSSERPLFSCLHNPPSFTSLRFISSRVLITCWDALVYLFLIPFCWSIRSKSPCSFSVFVYYYLQH